MKSTQLEILTGVLNCLQAGEQVTLVSVVSTWGASPRPVGSLLAVSNGGQFFGSVSGGCVEDDLIQRLVDEPVKKPQLILYGDTDEVKHRVALPCGSVLQLLAEPFNDIGEVQSLITQLENRLAVCRFTDLENGRVSIKPYQGGEQAVITKESWCNVFGPVWRLLIIGAGETSQYLARMAMMLGYSVAVSDPRPEYRKAWPLKDVPLLSGLADDALLAFKPDIRTAIAALSHDPRIDDMALLEALKSEAFYVGALGSQNNNKNRRKRLKDYFGFVEKDLQRLHGPIGLDIGSKTPPEIALSTMAEITALRNRLGAQQINPPGQALAKTLNH